MPPTAASTWRRACARPLPLLVCVESGVNCFPMFRATSWKESWRRDQLILLWGFVNMSEYIQQEHQRHKRHRNERKRKRKATSQSQAPISPCIQKHSPACAPSRGVGDPDRPTGKNRRRGPQTGDREGPWRPTSHRKGPNSPQPLKVLAAEMSIFIISPLPQHWPDSSTTANGPIHRLQQQWPRDRCAS